MEEEWVVIEGFPNYSISNYGRVRTNYSGRILVTYQNQSGVVQVGLMDDGRQKHRSVPLLVAKGFIRQDEELFDTPINLDGDRLNNFVDNLTWRPRWFAIKYHQQFRLAYPHRINFPLEDLKTGEITSNSLECAKRYGLLEKEIVMAIANNTYVWPTYQIFRVKE